MIRLRPGGRAARLARSVHPRQGPPALACEPLEDRNLLSFIVQNPFPSGAANPAAVATADLFNHQQPDLAVTNNNLGAPTGSVTIYKNTTTSPVGDITFSQTQDIPLGREPIGITTGQFTNSGLNDLVIANNGDGDGTIEVILNDPNNPGTFLVPVSYTVGGKPFSVVVGQFTASGNQDILVGTSTNTVSLLLGNGDGTFQAPIPIATGGDGGLDVFAGPFTPGGNFNIVVANNSSNTISVLLGNGDGTFQPPVIYPVGVQPYTVAVGDVNNDGFADIVVANQDPSNPDGSTVSVLLNDGTNNFPTRHDYPAGGSPTDVLLGNFRGDNRVDIAVSNFLVFGGGVSVLLNNGDGTYGTATKYTTGSLGTGIAVADYNGDGFADIVVLNAFSNNISVLRNDMQTAPPPGGSGDASPVRPVPVQSTGPTEATVAPVLPFLGAQDHTVDEVSRALLRRTPARQADSSAFFFDFDAEGGTVGGWLI